MSAADAATYAPAASPPTTADMQNVCDALASGDGYQVILAEGAVQSGTPTFDTSTIADDENSRVADHTSATSPFGDRAFYGSVGRHGGSVNLFSTVGYPGITYAGSFVDQYADRTETDTYNFTCQVQHYEAVGSHEVTIPGDGQYIVDPALEGTPQYNAQLQACNAFNDAHAKGITQGFWGNSPQGNCVFQGSPDTTETVTDYAWVNSGTAQPEVLTDGPYFYDNELYQGQASEPTVSKTETDKAPYFAGDVAVCINPGKKGGKWTTQNGFNDPTLATCNTTYFNSAPYISGANVFNSASLPPQ